MCKSDEYNHPRDFVAFKAILLLTYFLVYETRGQLYDDCLSPQPCPNPDLILSDVFRVQPVGFSGKTHERSDY